MGNKLFYKFMRITILCFIVLCFFKVDAIEGINIHLLDSAEKYCKGKYRNYEKTNVLVNQLISQGLKVKNDSILAEAYYLKALNNYRWQLQCFYNLHYQCIDMLRNMHLQLPLHQI